MELNGKKMQALSSILLTLVNFV